MTDKNTDWLKGQIDAHCLEPRFKDKKVKLEDGTEGTERVQLKSTTFNFDKFMSLAAENGVEVTNKHHNWMTERNGPGRVRMTLGNMLRKNVKDRGTLLVDGEVVEAPPDYRTPEKPAKADTETGEAAV